VQPGTSAVVIGIGGLGHVAVQLLRALSAATVVAVDVRAEALELALRAGAHAALLADELIETALRDAIGSRGAGLVIDCVGSDATLALAGGAVAPGGHIAIVGLAGGTLAMRRGGVALEAPVVISNWGTRAELAEVVALARAGHVELEVERVALPDVVAAYGRLERGEVRGRLVAVPNQHETGDR
jgi:alcohol dehydrogenase, propanol-preferring